MRNDSVTNWTIAYRVHSVLQTFLQRFCSNVGKRWIEEKNLCMLKKFCSPERFATFVNDRVTSPTHAQQWKNDYGRLPTFSKKSENARRALAKTSWCDGSLIAVQCWCQTRLRNLCYEPTNIEYFVRSWVLRLRYWQGFVIMNCQISGLPTACWQVGWFFCDYSNVSPSRHAASASQLPFSVIVKTDFLARSHNISENAHGLTRVRRVNWYTRFGAFSLVNIYGVVRRHIGYMHKRINQPLGRWTCEA